MAVRKKPKPLGKARPKVEPELSRPPMFPHEVIVGGWYLCVFCKSCEAPIALWQAEGPHIPIHVDNSFVFQGMPCPTCSAPHDYPATAIRLLQAQPEEPTQ
jgi:hypothetical protein